jgi:hypothetical protein
MKKEPLAILSGLLALLIPFLCCFGLPLLVLVVGGSAATFAAAFAEQYAPIFWLLGTTAIGWAGWQFWKKRQQKTSVSILQSTLICPNCGFQKTETMPTDACQFFYKCENCQTMLKPKPGDCCVFCSYGTVKCPPMQVGEKCC